MDLKGSSPLKRENAESVQSVEVHKEDPSTESSVLPTMTAGVGKNSYVQNSNRQAVFMERIFPGVLKLVDEMKIFVEGRPDVVRVVDLGCSSGPNTILNVEKVLRRMKRRYGRGEEPEFQAFFQDLHESDFNTLFRFFKTVSANSAVNASDDLKYFVAGVPGSCYERVLPAQNVHFVMSTFALHWLSRIPPVVYDPNHKAYIGPHKELEFTSQATIDAYAEQANIDLQNFLDARAKEMVPGGIMSLVFGIRKVYYPYHTSSTDGIIEQVWDEMISEGSVNKKLKESFSSYAYFRYLKDVEEVLDSYSSIFKIEHQEVLQFFTFPPGMAAWEKGAAVVSLHRGIYTGILEGHFGKEATVIFWAKYEQAVITGFTDGTLAVEDEITTLFLVVLATRI